MKRMRVGIMPKQVSLSESLGDYIETIYHLVEENTVARVKNIAERMNVHMSSVTGALKSLADKKLVNYEPYSVVTLTRRGKTVARDLVHRHSVLLAFFNDVLQLDAETANRNACHIEHAIEPQVLERLVDFLKRAT